MAVDPYAQCPCGSGKKLKFCCSDLAGDIEKIYTMIDGDQPRAALRHTEQSLARHPQRESLLDIKATLELTLEQLDDAAATIAQMIEVAPKNPSAFAQQAVLTAARQGGRAAVVPLQQAFSLVEGAMPRRVLQAVGLVGQALLMEGNIVAARAHLWLYQGIAGHADTQALQLLMRLNQMPGLPLPLRDHLYLQEVPEGHPGEEDHQRAQWYASVGGWLHAAQAFDALCGLYPDQPSFVYNRGLVYGWLGDVERFVAGMHDYAQARSQAASDDSSELPDDAIEAESIAQLLDPRVKDAPIDVVRIVYPVADEDALLQRLGDDPRVSPYNLDESEHSATDGPPPRHSYLLLNKPLPESGAELTRDQVPSVVGFLSHYGRQTNRAERLELVVDKNDAFDSHTALLQEVAGDALGPVESEDRVGESNDAEQALSWRWHFPPDTPPALRRELLAEQRRDAILQLWPETPRAALGGKSPRAAASDPAQRIPLAAAVALLEQGTNNHKYADTFVELRQQLSLPIPGPIEPAEVDIEQLPLSRVPRLRLEQITDDDLVRIYRQAALAGAAAAGSHLAREVIRRPSVHDRIPLREAYDHLIAQEEDTPRALELVDEARRASEAVGESSAEWDILELELHVVEGASDKANQMLQHLRAEHFDEPGVAEQLYELLFALGATPDNVPMGSGEGPPVMAESAAGDQTSKIWTPDGASGDAKQKLWTPS